MDDLEGGRGGMEAPSNLLSGSGGGEAPSDQVEPVSAVSSMATMLQAQWRGKQARKDVEGKKTKKSGGGFLPETKRFFGHKSQTSAESEAATKVQASYRARMSRMSAPVVPKAMLPTVLKLNAAELSPSGLKRLSATPAETPATVRSRMAVLLFPTDAVIARDAKLASLAAAIEKDNAPEWTNLEEVLSQLETAAQPDAASRFMGETSRLATVDKYGKAVTRVQARAISQVQANVRGLLTRKRLRTPTATEGTKATPGTEATTIKGEKLPASSLEAAEVAIPLPSALSPGGLYAALTDETDIATKPGMMQVHISHATGVMKADHFNASDPYVVVKVGGTKEKTPVVGNTESPTFDCTLNFPGSLEEVVAAPMVLHVYDYDVTKLDELLGKASIDLAEHRDELLAGNAIKMVAELDDGQKVPAKVYLTLEWSATEKLALPSLWQGAALIGVASALLMGLGKLADLPYVGALFLILEYVLYYLLVLLVLLYSWLRLPYWLGWLASELITRLAVYNYPLRMTSLRVRPWLQATPLCLHLDLHVHQFRLANPAPPPGEPGCPHEHFVFADDVHAVVQVGLSAFSRLIKGKALMEPIVIRVKWLRITGVELNLEMSSTGVFNIPALVSALAEGELKQAIGGIGVFPFRDLSDKMPNLLKIKIGAVRKLRKRLKLKPRIKVSLRQTTITTIEGTPSGEPDDDGIYTSFDFHTDTIMLPHTNAATVLLVQVLNGSALLGQWFMTTKWIYADPYHCKHSALKVHPNGMVVGTFLLCDGKMHGSAVRTLGPHDMGEGGFCGEIDMGIHWIHCKDYTPPLAAETRKPIDQLNEGTADDLLRLGNLAELRTMLTKLPIRLDINQMTVRDLNVRMKDMFAGNHVNEKKTAAGLKEAKTAGVNEAQTGGLLGKFHSPFGKTKDPKEDRSVAPTVNVKLLDFDPMYKVSVIEFAEKFAVQAASRVLRDRKAIFGGLSEIFAGLGQDAFFNLGFLKVGDKKNK